MTSALTLRAGERGMLRLFALDLPRAQAEALRGNAAALARLFGVAALDADGVEVLDLADLDELGLALYLTEGEGLDPSEIAPQQAEIDALTGHALILHSSAARGQALQLVPDPALRLIGAYVILNPPVLFEPLPRGGAEGTLAPPARAPKSDARIGGMVATVVLLFLALFTVAFIWMAR